jgi:hypothetical protein
MRHVPVPRFGPAALLAMFVLPFLPAPAPWRRGQLRRLTPVGASQQPARAAGGAIRRLRRDDEE